MPYKYKYQVLEANPLNMFGKGTRLLSRRLYHAFHPPPPLPQQTHLGAHEADTWPRKAQRF